MAVLVLATACRRDLPPPAAPAVAPSARAEAVAPVVKVTAVQGKVMCQTTSGVRTEVKAGDTLPPEALLVAASGATAQLDVAGIADVEVADGTEVSIGELSATLSKVSLRDGRLAAVVHGAARRLEVDVPGASASATTNDGAFSMLASGSHLSVATTAGQVTLAARGRAVRIGAGQLSLVDGERGDRGPSDPQPLPASLFLKLGASRAITQREKKTTVRGTTTPGAVVSVNGVRLMANEAGEFALIVPLREGTNLLVVESRDALGRSERVTAGRVTVDSRAPESQTRVEW